MSDKPSVAVSYKVMRHEKEYLKIVAANIVNRFGDSIDAVAFGWLVYQLTGSREWLAVILGVNLLPTVLLQPFAGAWINYLNKKVVMVLCDFGRGLLVLGIAVGYMMGILTPVALLVITILNSSLEALRQPCGMAVTPLIVKHENFPVASALNQSTSRASELIGMGLAGIIIATMGVGGAILIDAITFFLSGGILCLLNIPHSDPPAAKSYFGELKNGLRYFFECRAVVMVTLICVLLNFIEFPIDSLKAAYISESLQMGEIALTVGSIALSIGMFAGSLLFPRIFAKASGRKICLGCGLFVGFFYLLLTVIPVLPSTLRLALYGLGNLAFGFVIISVNMAIGVAIFQNVEGSYMARVGSLFNAIACTSAPVAAAFTAVITGLLPMNTLYLVMGIVTLVLFIGLSLTRSMRALK